MQTQSYPLPRGSPYGGTARLGSLREWRNTNRAVRVYELPPSFRFPPLREGNREGRAYSVPPAGRGNLKEGGVSYACFYELWSRDWYKRVGFLRACLLAALPSRALLPPCERDARAPSTRDAGNAGVPPAMPTVRGKTYPFKGGFTFTCFCELRLRGWYQCFVAPLEPKHLNLPTLPPKVAGIDTPSV